MKIPQIEPGRNGHQNGPSNGHGILSSTTNGHLEAPASLQRPQRRTTFLPDASGTSWRAFLYLAYRHQIGGVALTRWLILTAMVLAVFWALGVAPLRWIGAVFFLLLAGLLATAVVVGRRRDFVDFTEEEPPAVAPRILDPSDKIALHVTGQFSVEGKYARFTWLPGYYRTFATREHALLCLVRDRRFLSLGRWAEEEVGMWYIFFTADLVERIRWGKLHFDGAPKPTIAVDYRLTMVREGRSRREQIVEETVYLTCDDEADVRRILADLVNEAPAPAGLQPQSVPTNP